MTFEKTEQIIERTKGDWEYLLIRRLVTDENLVTVSEKEIIAEIINSKYHHWDGERRPGGLTGWMGTTGNYKFYGFYDNSKIKPGHYQYITFDEFYLRLMVAINDEVSRDKDFAQRVMDTVNKHFKGSYTYYFLNLDREKNADIVAKHHVYDIFYAFIAFDWMSNCIFLIEFGLD